MCAGEITCEDGLCAVGVALLRVERGTRHVRDHGVAAAPGVLGVAQRVVIRSGLWEPDVATVTSEVTALQSIGDVLLDDNSATGSVDEP